MKYKILDTDEIVTEKEKNRILKIYGTRAIKEDNDSYFIKKEENIPLF